MDVIDKMVCQEFKVLLERGDHQDLLEHRGHLDAVVMPSVGESMGELRTRISAGVGELHMLGGAEPLVPMEQEQNWFMLAGPLEAVTLTVGEEPITCA